MKITHVTVCVDYLDYMAVAYAYNRGQFDEFIVITSPNDYATRAWCKAEKVTCIATDAFYRDGAVFNKGAAINEGFKVLRDTEWVCLTDADTFVPLDFRIQLDQIQLNKECLYGARRILLPLRADYEDWASGRKADDTFESPNGFGFGFLQLFNWHSHAIQSAPWGQWYPSYLDATCCDWMFLNRFGDLADEYTRAVGNVRELPFSVYNLGPHGQNHQGRLSPKFDI